MRTMLPVALLNLPGIAGSQGRLKHEPSCVVLRFLHRSLEQPINNPKLMKITRPLVIALIAAAIAMPSVASAAKGDRKKNATPAVTFAAADKDNDGNVTESE